MKDENDQDVTRLFDTDNVVFTFDLNVDCTASRTNVVEGDDESGITYMGLTKDHFTVNPDSNFEWTNEEITVIDGYQKIIALPVTVTIVGNNNDNEPVVYNGSEHSVTGYTATADSNLYDIEHDFTFTPAEDADLDEHDVIAAKRTDAGTTNMGLAADQFSDNNNTNFNVSFNVTDGYLTIAPRPVTVTAENKSKTYKDADPELTAIVTGAVEGETLDYTVTRQTGENQTYENVGEYPITVTAGENPNYTVNTKGATFTIIQKVITIAADDKKKEYDNNASTDPELTVKVTTKINDEEVELSEEEIAGINYTIERVSGQNVGSYIITVSEGQNPNYDVTVVNGTFTIVKPCGQGHRNRHKQYPIL